MMESEYELALRRRREMSRSSLGNVTVPRSRIRTRRASLRTIWRFAPGSSRRRERTTATDGGKSMHLSDQGLIVILVVGLVAGWLAGKVVRGKGSASSAMRRSASSAPSSATASASPRSSFQLRRPRSRHQRHDRSDRAPARLAAHGRERMGQPLAGSRSLRALAPGRERRDEPMEP